MATKFHFNKGTIGTTEWKATTALTDEEANKAKAQLEKQGYKVTIEAKYYYNVFLWLSVSGEKSKHIDYEAKMQRMIVKCGDGCGFSYGR